MMVGHKVNLTVTKDEHEPSDVVLKVDHLSYQPKTSDKLLLNDVSFEVRKGEIVCIIGRPCWPCACASCDMREKDGD